MIASKDLISVNLAAHRLGVTPEVVRVRAPVCGVPLIMANPVWPLASPPIPHVRESHFAHLEKDKKGHPQMWGQDAVRDSVRSFEDFGRIETAPAPLPSDSAREKRKEPKSE